MSEKDLRLDEEARKELARLGEQFIDLLYKYGNPHSLITIEQVGIKFYSGECGSSFALRD